MEGSDLTQSTRPKAARISLVVPAVPGAPEQPPIQALFGPTITRLRSPDVQMIYLLIYN